MNREKTKQFPIGFTERHREMIQEIKNELGYPTIASVVQQAVVDMYQGVKSLSSGNLNQNLNNEDKEINNYEESN